MINIPHIDLKIWNPEQRAIEIIGQLQNNKYATLNIDSEGSDCETLGLYRILDNICRTFSVDPSAITIHTCNQLEKHDQYRLIKHPPLYIDSGQKFARENKIGEKHWNSIKHFGMLLVAVVGSVYG